MLVTVCNNLQHLIAGGNDIPVNPGGFRLWTEKVMDIMLLDTGILAYDGRPEPGGYYKVEPDEALNVGLSVFSNMKRLTSIKFGEA